MILFKPIWLFTKHCGYTRDEIAAHLNDKTLRGRMALIREHMKKTQTLQLTFVTTFGVRKNMYSGIVQSEVTLDDLFE